LVYLYLYIVYAYLCLNSMSTTKSSSSSIDNENNTEDILVVVPDNVYNSSLDTEMTSEKIYMQLKKKKLTIVNAPKTHTADCWTNFGFPAVVDQDGNIVKKFNNFVACRNCFVTYSFKSNSTTLMNKHNCDTSSTVSSSTNFQNNSQSLKQSKISSYTFKSPQCVKLKECEKNKIKKLQVEWTCTDIRPFSIMDDKGLRALAQELIALGIIIYTNIPSFILLCYYRFKVWKYFC
jgi:hypothetical protein